VVRRSAGGSGDAVYRAPMAAASPDDTWVTIDELASSTSMTVRNIRAHQSRGLLPPPRIVGRTGYYGPHHRRRLDQIRQLQDEGLNLAAIERILNDGRLTDVAAGVFREAEGTVVDPLDLLARLGGETVEIGPDAVDRAVEAGVIAVQPDGIHVASPRLLAVAEDLARLGVPLDAQFDAAQGLRAAAEQVAETFMRLADAHLVTRVAIDTKGDLAHIEAAVERLHALARQALEAVFDQAMSARIADYFAAEAAPLDGEPAAPSSS